MDTAEETPGSTELPEMVVQGFLFKNCFVSCQDRWCCGWWAGFPHVLQILQFWEWLWKTRLQVFSCNLTKFYVALSVTKNLWNWQKKNCTWPFSVLQGRIWFWDFLLPAEKKWKVKWDYKWTKLSWKLLLHPGKILFCVSKTGTGRLKKTGWVGRRDLREWNELFCESHDKMVWMIFIDGTQMSLFGPQEFRRFLLASFLPKVSCCQNRWSTNLRWPHWHVRICHAPNASTSKPIRAQPAHGWTLTEDSEFKKKCFLAPPERQKTNKQIRATKWRDCLRSHQRLLCQTYQQERQQQHCFFFHQKFLSVGWKWKSKCRRIVGLVPCVRGRGAVVWGRVELFLHTSFSRVYVKFCFNRWKVSCQDWQRHVR